MSYRLLRRIVDKAAPQLDLQDLAESVTLDRWERRALMTRTRKATQAYHVNRRKRYEDLFDQGGKM